MNSAYQLLQCNPQLGCFDFVEVALSPLDRTAKRFWGQGWKDSDVALAACTPMNRTNSAAWTCAGMMVKACVTHVECDPARRTLEVISGRTVNRKP
jgi:hypothetical protein